MLIPEKLREVLKQDGVVALATQGAEGPHLVNTWNAYIAITGDERLLIPAGYFHTTEANLALHPEILLTLGSSKVPGFQGPGTGFLIKGKAVLICEGPEFEATKTRFPWARGVVSVTIASATQTL